MAKPTTGHVEHVPEPDPDQMATDTLMTSVFSGVCLIGATVIFKAGFAVGLALGMALIAWTLRRYAERIRARSANLYRGAWIGSVAALVIIALMYFAPQVAFPQYCPPGQLCVNNQRQ
ncbi:MAG: hypothetical protein MUF09_11430 [Candidatus Nanopelagicales bacterium]|nr:hypothetical protein [Candidatus Nanopelagicales bacterium]